MTISSTATKTSYVGDGATTAFAVPFAFFGADEIEVIERTIASGAEAPKALATDYTVAGGNGSTGTVAAAVAPPASVQWHIRRKTKRTQLVDYTPNDPFPAETHERALDRLSAVAQEQDEVLGRGLSLAKTSGFAGALTFPDPGAGRFLRWNAGGTALETADVAALGAIALPLAVAQGGTGQTGAAAALAALGGAALAGATFTGAINEAQGADIASAATIDLDGATGNLVDVTGTAAIAAITLSQGRERTVRFTGALTLTHGASLVLPGAANIATAAGDFATFRGYAGGVVRCAGYTRANGTLIVTSGTLPRSYIAGLTLSNSATDATNDIDIAAGVARDGANAADLVLAAALTKRLDAAWAVGTNQGGLDAGTIANGTYHVWLIKRSDTGVVDALYSTSASAPTMPANYDAKRRIGSIIRSGGAILAFDQVGDQFFLRAPMTDVSAASTGPSAVTRTLASVPVGVAVRAVLGLGVGNGSQSDMVYLSALTSADMAPSISSAPGAHAYSSGANILAVGYAEVMTNTSAQIRSRGNSASSALYIQTRGWVDDRGSCA